MFKQIFNSNANVINTIRTTLFDNENDEHRAMLKLTEKTNYRQVTCTFRGCDFLCKFTRKKGKDKWNPTVANQVHRHLPMRKRGFVHATANSFVVKDVAIKTDIVMEVANASISERELAAEVHHERDLPTLAACKKTEVAAAPNGFCGYNSITMAIHGSQKQKSTVIKKMREQLIKNQNVYSSEVRIKPIIYKKKKGLIN